MDGDTSEGRALLNDLESGRLSSEEGSENGSINSLLESNTSDVGEMGNNSYLEVIIKRENDEECRAVVEKKYAKKKSKKINYKKASKPPRPPRGPSLDASDMMLVKEFSAHAINKRARIDRLRALRKIREEKSTFFLSKSSIWAMMFTVLFIFVIFFQGFCSKGVNSVNFHGSPEPAANSMISVQFFNNPAANDGSELGSTSSPEETIGSVYRFPE